MHTISSMVPCEISRSVRIDPTEEEWLLYPNPTEGSELNLRLDEAIGHEMEITVVDQLGRAIMPPMKLLGPFTDPIRLSLAAGIPAGRYTVLARDRDRLRAMPLVLLR